jgi:prevent-host-death family protein
MDRIHISDAKLRLSELVGRAEAGEIVEILRHGRSVAHLSPAEVARKPVGAAALAGLTSRPTRQDLGAAKTVRTMRDWDRY